MRSECVGLQKEVAARRGLALDKGSPSRHGRIMQPFTRLWLGVHNAAEVTRGGCEGVQVGKSGQSFASLRQHFR
jgi:hypothetical protein